MSIYDKEMCRIFGDMKCAVRIQNDFTGTIRTELKKVNRDDKGNYYVNADGSRHIITDAVNSFLQREHIRSTEHTFYETHKIR